MKINLDKYIVQITFRNGFTKRELTQNRLNLIKSQLENNVCSTDNWTVFGDYDFPEDIYETTNWDDKFNGVVFEWKVVDYISDLYPTYKIDNKEMTLCYQYFYNNFQWYEDNKTETVLYETPIFCDKKYKLMNIGYCSKNLITQE